MDFDPLFEPPSFSLEDVSDWQSENRFVLKIKKSDELERKNLSELPIEKKQPKIYTQSPENIIWLKPIIFYPPTINNPKEHQKTKVKTITTTTRATQTVLNTVKLKANFLKNVSVASPIRLITPTPNEKEEKNPDDEICSLMDCFNEPKKRTTNSLKMKYLLKPEKSQCYPNRICDTCYFKDRYQYRKYKKHKKM